jgi:hypothetical protein
LSNSFPVGLGYFWSEAINEAELKSFNTKSKIIIETKICMNINLMPLYSLMRAALDCKKIKKTDRLNDNNKKRKNRI